MTAIPTLRTPRLNLRPLRASDLDGFVAMFADADVMRFIGPRRPRDTVETWRVLESMLGHWAMRGYGFFALESRETGALVGRAGILHPLDWLEPELAYALAKPFWGQGLATEAACAARAWAFDWFGFERLASFIHPDNTASIKVANRLGAVQEGLIQADGFTAQHWVHYPPGRGAIA